MLAQETCCCWVLGGPGASWNGPPEATLTSAIAVTVQSTRRCAATWAGSHFQVHRQQWLAWPVDKIQLGAAATSGHTMRRHLTTCYRTAHAEEKACWQGTCKRTRKILAGEQKVSSVSRSRDPEIQTEIQKSSLRDKRIHLQSGFVWATSRFKAQTRANDGPRQRLSALLELCNSSTQPRFAERLAQEKLHQSNLRYLSGDGCNSDKFQPSIPLTLLQSVVRAS